MNGAHYHLILNHLPIIIPVIGLLVLLGGLIWNSGIVKRTAFLIFILAAISAYAADATGGDAARVLSEQNLAEKKFIKTHAHMAGNFAMLSYALAVLSAVGIWATLKRKSLGVTVAVIVAVGSLVVIYYGTMTGNSGGEIRHTEIRADSL
jgi:hypothetical protein